MQREKHEVQDRRRETDSGNNCNFNPSRTCTKVRSLVALWRQGRLRFRRSAANRATRKKISSSNRHSRNSQVICLFVQLCNWQYISFFSACLFFCEAHFLLCKSWGGLKGFWARFGSRSNDKPSPRSVHVAARAFSSRAFNFDLQQQQLNWTGARSSFNVALTRECRTQKKRSSGEHKKVARKKVPLQIYEDSACKSRRREQFKLVGNAWERIDCGAPKAKWSAFCEFNR